MQLPVQPASTGSTRPPSRPSRDSRRRGLALSAVFTAASLTGSADAQTADGPRFQSILVRGGEVVISAQVPAGYRHASLEGSDTVTLPFSEALVAAGTTGASGTATFRIPNLGSTRFLRIRLGTDTTVPPALYPADGHFSIEYSGNAGPLTADERTSHVLSRLTYGPTADDLQSVQTTGISAFIEQQLNPAAIDESTNTELAAREAALFDVHQPREDTRWISPGDTWRYFKGTQAPPAAWKDAGFNDATWAQGPSGFGYGDDDDATELTDMFPAGASPGYLTVFVRRTFTVTSPEDNASAISRRSNNSSMCAEPWPADSSKRCSGSSGKIISPPTSTRSRTTSPTCATPTPDGR
jgi:hypothetical protein